MSSVGRASYCNSTGFILLPLLVGFFILVAVFIHLFKNAFLFVCPKMVLLSIMVQSHGYNSTAAKHNNMCVTMIKKMLTNLFCVKWLCIQLYKFSSINTKTAVKMTNKFLKIHKMYQNKCFYKMLNLKKRIHISAFKSLKIVHIHFHCKCLTVTYIFRDRDIDR